MTLETPPPTELDQRPRFVLDASALIDMEQLWSGPVFAPIWDTLGKLGDEGVLLAPRPVLKEVESKGATTATVWMRAHRPMIVTLDRPIWDAAREIANHPEQRGLVDLSRRWSADVFVVALALSLQRSEAGGFFGRETYVVAHEARQGRRRDIRIPDACAQVGVPCIRAPELLERAGVEITVIGS
jgi:hypothetical protein